MECYRNIYLVAFFIVLLGAASLDPVISYEIANDHDAMMYLNRFGYVDDETMTDNMSMSRIKPMLMEFQKMCNINRTGLLDRKTVEMMNAPRCGNLDMDVNRTEHHTMFMQDLEGVDEGMLRRYRRFAINDNKLKWKKKELTYRMAMFSTKMGSHVNEKQVLEEVHKAFKLWSEVTNLDFFYTPKRKEVDIELSFTTRFHMQDQFPFDGPGKTLAHAFPPGEGVLGDVHFEDEEEWTISSPKGINVLFVAVHEIGHALGLSHSMVKGAIMQPFYGGYSPKLRLHKDDIEGVQSLYGKRETKTFDFKPNEREPVATTTTTKTTTTTTRRPTPRTTARPPTPPPRTTEAYRHRPQKENLRPDLCQDSSIDAITTLADGSVYAFKEKYAYLIHPKGKGVGPGWPHRIEAIFKGLDADLDAAVTRKNGKTYFFKGPYYWRFRGTQMDPGYPKRISIHFKGVPDNVDSAFEWLGAIYFTKGDKIWRFDPTSKPFVSDKFPIRLSVWDLGQDIDKIDASFTAPNGNIYFFSGQVYWRFDEKRFKVSDNLQPGYPRSSKVMWFGCTGGTPVDYREIRQSDYQDDFPGFSYPSSVLDYFEYPRY